MAEDNDRQKTKVRFPFRLKIGLVITIMAVGANAVSVYYIYRETKALTIALMSDRLLRIARTSLVYFSGEPADTIRQLMRETDRDADYDLSTAKRIQPGGTLGSLSPETADRLMSGERFQSLVAILRRIKDGTNREVRTDSGVKRNDQLIKYAYLLVRDPNFPDMRIVKFLADADYEPKGDEPGNPIGNLYVVKQKSFREAFAGHMSAEEEFISDKWGTWLTAATPIFDKDGSVLAVLGLDMDVSSENNKVNQLFYICMSSIGLTFLLSVIVAMKLSKILSRPVQKLKDGAERVRKRDFSTQIRIKNRDELGVLADTFNSMVEEIRTYATELEETNQVYYRFVPKEFLQILGLKRITDITLGDQIQKEMSVLFSDIRSFTTLSESMSPKENFDFLNDLLKNIGPVIRRENGFIDKYIGDAIMALFPGDAGEAVRSAVEMRRTLKTYNAFREKRGEMSVDMGVGIHTGNLMMGTIGEEERMQSTVISDAVNLASRLEGLTKLFGAPIIISDGTKQKLSDAMISENYIRPLGSVLVKGKTKTVLIYEVMAGEEPEYREKKLSYNDRFIEGIESFRAGNWPVAEKIFAEIVGMNDRDKAAFVYLAKCRKAPGL